MKKISILIVLLSACTDIFAVLTQANWRWRNDDGPQTTATWKALQNTQITLTSTSEIVRLRLEVFNPNTLSPPIAVFDVLQYATSPAGPWTNVEITADSRPFMIANTSAFVVQDEPTTEQLSGLAYIFQPGKIMVNANVLTDFTSVGFQRTEFEWAIRGTSNTVLNTTYYFRQWGSTTQLYSGINYPSLITAGVLPVRFSAFSLSQKEKKIKLEWVTASEQDNDRFEIQRSKDGRTWITIAKIKGHGTATGTGSYELYDDNPLSGNNYYVIRQYDADGHSYLSDVKLLRMAPHARSMISIFPNPSRAGVNFSLADHGYSNVEVILTNVNGTVIHREIIKSVQANTNNKLHLTQQPVPGLYILKLKAEELSESLRVIIE